MNTPVHSRGFTLIELLVVIAIIAILAAILFPVFARAREKARQTTCSSNQRQIAASAQMYAQDHDETFPASAAFWQSVNVDAGVLVCPTLGKGTPNGYGASLYTAGQAVGTITDPTTAMLICDSKNPQNLVTYGTDIDTRHTNAAIMAYIDGHVATNPGPIFGLPVMSVAIPTSTTAAPAGWTVYSDAACTTQVTTFPYAKFSVSSSSSGNMINLNTNGNGPSAKRMFATAPAMYPAVSLPSGSNFKLTFTDFISTGTKGCFIALMTAGQANPLVAYCRSNNLGNNLYEDNNYWGWGYSGNNQPVSNISVFENQLVNFTIYRINNVITFTATSPAGTTTTPQPPALTSTQVSNIANSIDGVAFWVNDSGNNQFGNIVFTQ